MSNIKNRKEGGFTIIEVLIVLAIAGLIMLIVFLAVPALQRNSRNTQIKNAASAVLGAVSEYQNNNGGTLPSNVSVSGGKVEFAGASGSGSATSSAKIQGDYTVETGNTMPTGTGAMIVNFGVKCNGNEFGGTTARSVAIGFRIETSGGTATQCVES